MFLFILFFLARKAEAQSIGKGNSSSVNVNININIFEKSDRSSNNCDVNFVKTKLMVAVTQLLFF